MKFALSQRYYAEIDESDVLHTHRCVTCTMLGSRLICVS